MVPKIHRLHLLQSGTLPTSHDTKMYPVVPGLGDSFVSQNIKVFSESHSLEKNSGLYEDH